MKIDVVYASRSGNTHLIARTISEALRSRGEVELLAIDDTAPQAGIDLLIVGGPTEGHGMTPAVKAFLDRLPPLRGVQVAAFDTRLKWPFWLSGSAARDIAKRLEEAGGNLIAPPESFLVTMEPKLLAGERERAEAWALRLPVVTEMAQAV